MSGYAAFGLAAGAAAPAPAPAPAGPEEIREAIVAFVRRQRGSPPSADDVAATLIGGLRSAYASDPLYGAFRSRGITRDRIKDETTRLYNTGVLLSVGFRLVVAGEQGDAAPPGGGAYASGPVGWAGGASTAGAASRSSSSVGGGGGGGASSSSYGLFAPQPSLGRAGVPTASSSASYTAAAGLPPGDARGGSSSSAAAAAAAPPAAAGAPTADADSPLSAEQRAVYDLALSGKSIFFTGSAGTGKSFLLRRIIDGLRGKHASRSGAAAAGGLGPQADAVYVTAPTGIAACNIGGTTIHSFAGIGRGDGPADRLATEVERKPVPSARWKAARVLVIDEISMLDGELLDKLELIARRVRNSSTVFGGLQLILAGDAFQLPPVGAGDSGSGGGGSNGWRGGRGGSSWRGRGGGRGGYGGGSSSPAAIGGGSGARFFFEAACWGRLVYACVGLSQVFRQKDPRFVGLLNELRMGTVSAAAAAAIAAAGSGVTAAERAGITPTRIFALNRDVDAVNAAELAKCAGASVVFEAVDVGEEPYLGQLAANCAAPTQLTLKPGAQVILLKNLDPGRGLVNGARGVVTHFVEQPSDGGRRRVLPEVTFGLASGGSGGSGPATTLVEESEWSVELGSRTVASRVQLPLKLAYALSIHKSQGMTLDLLEVSLQGVFETGQAYVALSRAVSLERLRVRHFRADLVRAHPKVVAFYASLASAAAAAGAGGGSAGGGAVRAKPAPAASSSSSSSSSAAAAAAPASGAGAKRPAFHIPLQPQQPLQRPVGPPAAPPPASAAAATNSAALAAADAGPAAKRPRSDAPAVAAPAATKSVGGGSAGTSAFTAPASAAAAAAALTAAQLMAGDDFSDLLDSDAFF